MGVLVEELLEIIGGCVSQFPDKREGKNKRYDMKDLGMGALSVFFMQSPSFLAHQNALKQRINKSNTETLFNMAEIPTDNHIRSVLDMVPPEALFPAFKTIYEKIKASKILGDYRGIHHGLLIPLDGVQYFSSKKISCTKCSTRERHDGTIDYHHNAITPVVISPDHAHVIPLCPEFITPQDGDTKQDCEIQASKRWLNQHMDYYKEGEIITLLGDDLYAKEPFCKAVLDKGCHFIFVCKPESHKTLYEWIDMLDKGGDIVRVSHEKWTGNYHEKTTYRYTNTIPIRNGVHSLPVNWCQITVEKSDGTRVYKNAFITDFPITEDTVEEIARSGRARWKIENENNNTLKTKGYRFEHNFGHGNHFLASLFATFIILAFLCHTVLDLSCKTYQTLRQALCTRKRFFQDLRTLTSYLCFSRWSTLFTFMIEGLNRCHDPTDFPDFFVA